MKKLMMSGLCLFSLAISITSCQKDDTTVIPQYQQGAARKQIDLPEVTITANIIPYDFTSLVTQINLSSGYNSYNVYKFDITHGFSGDFGDGYDLNSKEFFEKLLKAIKGKLESTFSYHVSAQEEVILRTLTWRQLFQFYTHTAQARLLNQQMSSRLGEPSDDGFANAFTHTYWSWALTRSLGATTARQLTDAHEAANSSVNVLLTSQMDYKNNAFGISLANQTSTLSIDQLFYYAQQGYLWTIRNGILKQYSYQPPVNGNPGYQK